VSAEGEGGTGRSRGSGPGSSGSSVHRALTLHIDGGARGNPGPAAIGVVVDDADGEVVTRIAEAIGVCTNNVAEYTALLRGLSCAKELGASEVHVINDSELIAKQVNGIYRVKHPAMVPLHAEARKALAGFERWSIESVRRAHNAGADALVNQALDAAAGAR